VKSEPGPPMTLRKAAKARLRLIVWCRGAGIRSRRTSPSATGAGTLVLDWRERLVSSHRGGREVDFVVNGTKR